MPPVISLGFRFTPGEQISPSDLNNLVDQATVGGFVPADFDLTSLQFFSYGSSRPTLVRGAAHYDTTAGLEGMYFAFVSASAASVVGWLNATPRRECYCWASSAVSAYTPVFIGKPNHVSSNEEYTVFDGCAFPYVWQYSGASGADAALLVTLESVTNNKPVKCMWAGLLPDALLLTGASSRASIGAPLYSDYSQSGAFRAGPPSARSLPFGICRQNQPSGFGAILWGAGPAIEDLIA